MIPFRLLPILACLVAGLLPASAHHQSGSGATQYLAFWGGYRQPAMTHSSPVACLEGRFWEKGFVSIYAQGEPISEVR